MSDETATNTCQEAFEKLRSVYAAKGPLDVSERKSCLKKLEKELVSNRTALAEAVSRDFRSRSSMETHISEVFGAHAAARHARTHFREWMYPESIELPWFFKPARARVEHQALGVVGIIAPWNYPILLSLSPLIGAIAAGNRVLLKPSEFCPETSALLSKILLSSLGEDVVGVVTGNSDVGAAFSALPFDHLLFTGSTAVGRKVMAAASENLTPVTLELGGKSPALIHDKASLKTAARRIAMGKMFNAGQTCIAPDYVLCPADKVDEFVKAFQGLVSSFYPTLLNNEAYTAIITDKHLSRLHGLVEEAVGGGATAAVCNPANEDFDGSPKMAPVLLTGVPDDALVLQEEIFGPVLPIIPYNELDEAIRYINERPRPLALYYFDRNRRRIREVTNRTVSGGVALNHTLVHAGVETLPFGGVGPSGMGSYHSLRGFETFSHRKSIYDTGRGNLVPALMNPKFSKLTKAFLRLLML